MVLGGLLALQVILFLVFQLWLINRGGMFLVLLGGTFLISFVIVFCYHSWIRYFYPIFVLAIWVLMLFCIQALGGCGDDMMCNAWFELKDYVVVFSGVGCACGCIGLAVKEIFRKENSY